MRVELTLLVDMRFNYIRIEVDICAVYEDISTYSLTEIL